MVHKTSISHPLLIAAVSPGPDTGRIGITFCPGKYDPHGISASWDRDLSLDVKAIKDWGAATVVTLLEMEELKLLRVERLGEEIVAKGMLWFHLPIVDASTPDEEFEKNWEVVGRDLRALLRTGNDIVVHCRGGLGRAGTVASRLLIEFGMSPAVAVREVRAARPGAIETSAQERYVLGMSQVQGEVQIVV